MHDAYVTTYLFILRDQVQRTARRYEDPFYRTVSCPPPLFMHPDLYKVLTESTAPPLPWSTKGSSSTGNEIQQLQDPSMRVHNCHMSRSLQYA